jgi:DNA uptake protein ComE-like DNA-binding protein
VRVATASPYGALSLLVAMLAIVALASSRADVPGSTSQTLIRSAPLAAPSVPAMRALRDGETLDLNTATHADLLLLPNIGPALATRIVEERARSGGFRRIEDLHGVRGIGPVTFARIARLVRVDTAPTQRSSSHDTVSDPVKYMGTSPADVSTNTGRSAAPTTTSRDHR